jgi:hypothetical protein
MLEALDTRESTFYANEAAVAEPCGKSETLFREIQQHYGFVGGSELEYAKYFNRGDLPQGYWRYVTGDSVKAVSGFSTVPKKDGNTQRKLLMSCATNYWWSDVRLRAEHGLQGAGAFTGIRVASDYWVLAAFDESNAFSYIKTPPWMWPWFCVPPLRAALIWSVLSEELKVRIRPDDWIYPSYTRLAMGCSHAVHILLNVNVTTIGRALWSASHLPQLEQSCNVLADLGRELLAELDPDITERGDGTDGKSDALDDELWGRKLLQHNRLMNHDGVGLDAFVRCCHSANNVASRVFVFLHLFSGPRRTGDVQCCLDQRASELGLQVICVGADTECHPDWDLANPRVIDVLLRLARNALISGAAGGPPCCTHSILRYQTLGYVGEPRPLRFRGLHEWGRPDLSAWERKRVNMANELIVNTLTLFEEISKNCGVHLFEHPRDPGIDPYPSVFATGLFQEWEHRTGSIRACGDQCPYGAIAKKATQYAGTVKQMAALEELCPGVSSSHGHDPASQRWLDGWTFRSKRLERYPPRLCQTIAECFALSFAAMLKDDVGPGGGKSTTTIPITTTWSRVGKGTEHVAFLNEFTGGTRGISLGQGQAAHYIHVDDGVFACDGLDLSVTPEDLMHRAADALEAVGFKVDDRRGRAQLQKIIGYAPSQRPAQLRLPDSKLAELHEELARLLQYWVVSVPNLHTAIGRWLWAMLLRRDLLSQAHGIFSFLERCEGQTVRWWPKAWLEVNSIKDTLFLAILDVGAPLASTIFASDAMGASHLDAGGYAVVAAVVDDACLDQIWSAGPRPGKTVIKLDGDMTRLRRPTSKLEARVPFSRLPQRLFNKSLTDWILLDKGRWRYEDAISLGEGRASLRVLQLLCKFAGAHRHVIHSLEDNMVWGGAAAKGRSPAPAINYLCRRKAAHLLATQMQLVLPWVQSADMPADFESRTV